jgi:hypothetical protein
MYDSNRLEWHLDDRTGIKPRRFLCGLVVQHDESFDQFNRLVVALAKSQDHRASCGVFVFGQHNAVRRWLCPRYSDTRASQIRERGRIARARWLKIVWHSAVATTWLHTEGQHRANFGFDHGKGCACSSIHHQRVFRGLCEMWITRG